jgi:hypothetical protein
MRSKWALAALILAVWALVASFAAGYYLLQYNNLSQQVSGLKINVDIGIDYGNGTRVFFNNTQAWTGETVLTVTKRVATVDTATSSLGTYVISINSKASAGNYGWTYWPWNSTAKSWDYAPVGADVYQIVTNNNLFLWYYQNSFNPPP